MIKKDEQEKLKIFGKRLRFLRFKRNISQEEFAGKTQLDRTYISGLERGKRNPSFLTLLKLAQTLNVPINQLFKGDEDNDFN